MTRQHARTVAAIARTAATGERIDLVAPMPGLFRCAVGPGELVAPGMHLGDLEVLGQLVAVVAPAGAAGVVVARTQSDQARAPTGWGDALLALDPHGVSASASAIAATTGAHLPSAASLVFRAPTSGRFYRRSGPDKAPFVEAGTELAPGATVCLLEVMKTFHRVTYGGPDLPERARVVRLLVADGDDVTAGDPLLALEA